VLDKAEYLAFESTLNSSIVSYIGCSCCERIFRTAQRWRHAQTRSAANRLPFTLRFAQQRLTVTSSFIRHRNLYTTSSQSVYEREEEPSLAQSIWWRIYRLTGVRDRWKPIFNYVGEWRAQRLNDDRDLRDWTSIGFSQCCCCCRQHRWWRWC